MSVQSDSPVLCAWCDEERDPQASVRGSFCSRDCWLRHKGDKALNQLRHDHRFCVSCGRQLKELEEPPDETLRQINGAESTHSLVGYQYRTPQADIGEIQRDGPTEYQDRIHTGTICECGVTDGREADPDLRQLEIDTVLKNLATTLLALWDEGAIDKKLDVRRYTRTYAESEDFALAVGRGLYG